MRIKDIAKCIGITERAAHRIVCELEAVGYVTRQRVGRRNFYEVHPELPVGQNADVEAKIGNLLEALLPSYRSEAA